MIPVAKAKKAESWVPRNKISAPVHRHSTDHTFGFFIGSAIFPDDHNQRGTYRMILCRGNRYLDPLVPSNEMMDRQSGNLDILSGRGKGKWNSPGNQRFKQLVHEYLKVYSDAPSKAEKSRIVESVVEAVSKMGGRFLKQDDPDGPWYEMDKSERRKKVAHAIRDHLATRKKHITMRAAKGNNTSPLQYLQHHAKDEEEEHTATKFDTETCYVQNKMRQFSDVNARSNFALLGDLESPRYGAYRSSLAPTPQEHQEPESSKRPAVLPAPRPTHAVSVEPSSLGNAAAPGTNQSLVGPDNNGSSYLRMLMQQPLSYDDVMARGVATESTSKNVLGLSGFTPFLPASSMQQQSMQQQLQVARLATMPNLLATQASPSGSDARSVFMSSNSCGRLLGSQQRQVDEMSSVGWSNTFDSPFLPNSTQTSVDPRQHRLSITQAFNGTQGQSSLVGNFDSVANRMAGEGAGGSLQDYLAGRMLQQVGGNMSQFGVEEQHEQTRVSSVLPPAAVQALENNTIAREAQPRDADAGSTGHALAVNQQASPTIHGTAGPAQGPVFPTPVTEQDEQTFTPLVARAVPVGVVRQSWDFVGESLANNDDDIMEPRAFFPPVE